MFGPAAMPDTETDAEGEKEADTEEFDLDRRWVGCENGSRSDGVSPIRLSTGSPS